MTGMETPFVDELVRRLRMDFSEVAVDIRPGGAATVRFRASVVDHTVALYVHEPELGAAVTDLGHEVRDELWPGASVEAAGFNILLVHLDEVLDTRDTTEPLRITRRGLTWPHLLRVD
jgi:hypothetical protein